MKEIFVGIGLSLFLMQAAHAERLDEIAAIVNGEVITCFEVETIQKGLKDQLQQGSGAEQDDVVLFDRALDSRVQRTLQYQEAETLGLKVAPAEVNAAMADVEKQNNLQPGQLTEVLKSQGIDEIGYRETVKDRILSSRLMNMAVRANLHVSEEAMREYYRKNLKDPKPVREVRTSQMFIAIPANADSETVETKRAEAEAFYQRFKAGEDFTSIVRIDSDAPNGSEGGDMGWISQGLVKGAFLQMFDVPIGDVTPVIRSGAGFHIIKVTDERMKKPENLVPYEEVHARHILLQIPPSSDLDTQIKIRQRAQKISEEMQDTTDEAFAVRAKELSQGPSAANGGDLGWFKPGQMVPEFDKAVFSMKPGEVSGIVETQFGLHIIRVLEKRKVNPNSFEAHKDNIQKLLVETEMQQQVPRWMQGLVERAKIEKRKCSIVSLAVVNTETGNAVSKDQYAEMEKIADTSADAAALQAVESDDQSSFVLSDWKEAWQNKDLEKYFSVYDNQHSPDQRFSSFKKWKAYKTRVVASHQDIHVEIIDMIEEVLEKGHRVEFSFDQHFKSNKLDDNDRKVIVMEKIGESWKIVSERTVQ
ncbi:MAG: peptidylprolyl isomerase [Ghiorsea sp.]